VWLCVRNLNLAEPAYAQAQPRVAPQEVMIVGVKSRDGFLPVNISGISERARFPVVITDVTTNDHVLPVKISGVANRDGLLPVNIAGYNSQVKPFPVSIESIQPGKRAGQALPWDALTVKTLPDGK
jgi:hypothetical protein